MVAGTYPVGAGGTITLGAGGNVTLGAGGNVTLGGGGNVTLGAGGNITLGGGGTVTLGAGGNVTLGAGGVVTLGGGGNVTLGAGGNITLGGGGNVTLGRWRSSFHRIGLHHCQLHRPTPDRTDRDIAPHKASSSIGLRPLSVSSRPTPSIAAPLTRPRLRSGHRGHWKCQRCRWKSSGDYLHRYKSGYRRNHRGLHHIHNARSRSGNEHAAGKCAFVPSRAHR